MLRLRHYHDGSLILETTIPFPAVQLQLKTAVKLVIGRSRNRQSRPFSEPIKDIGVRLVSFPPAEDVGPATIVTDDSTISVRTSSRKPVPIELWELD